MSTHEDERIRFTELTEAAAPELPVKGTTSANGRSAVAHGRERRAPAPREDESERREQAERLESNRDAEERSSAGLEARVQPAAREDEENENERIRLEVPLRRRERSEEEREHEDTRRALRDEGGARRERRRRGSRPDPRGSRGRQERERHEDDREQRRVDVRVDAGERVVTCCRAPAASK